jgi:hypothetical protein
MWRALRITVLLLVLLGVAGQSWLDRFSTTRWQRTVFIGASGGDHGRTDAAQCHGSTPAR